MTNTIPQSIIDKIERHITALVPNPSRYDAPFYTTADRYEDLREAAIWGYGLDKWISVKDGFPQEGERVLAYVEVSGHYCVAYLNVHSIWKNLFGTDVYGVTHYQYLPKPPKDI